MTGYPIAINENVQQSDGWSGGAVVLVKLSVPGRPTDLNIVEQGPTALAVGAGGDVWAFLSPLSFITSFSLSERRPIID